MVRAKRLCFRQNWRYEMGEFSERQASITHRQFQRLSYFPSAIALLPQPEGFIAAKDRLGRPRAAPWVPSGLYAVADGHLLLPKFVPLSYSGVYSQGHPRIVLFVPDVLNHLRATATPARTQAAPPPSA
jgi:hypothetical protein